MSRKILTTTKYSPSIVESYKPIKDPDSPILGTFTVKGMAVENFVSQNSTRYSKDVWASPYAFGKGGKFIDESGKLKPSTLYGSLDHPIDDRAEFRLEEGAIVWHDVSRNADGSWDGSAHIMNTPQGKIAKTFLEYAKLYGGGHLLGVSSRALGDTTPRIDESGRQVEDINTDGFELMTFDFVYNPSFQTAVASLTESKKIKKTLVESIQTLAKEDKEHKEVYEDFLKKFEKDANVVKDKNIKVESNALKKAKLSYYYELLAKEKQLYDALYELKTISDEEFAESYEDISKDDMYDKVFVEYEDVQAEIELLENELDKLPASKKNKVQEAAGKIIINDNGNIHTLNKPYDLYEMYNDFLIDDNINNPLSKEEKAVVEFIRDNYKHIYSKLLNSDLPIEHFEKLAVEGDEKIMELYKESKKTKKEASENLDEVIEDIVDSEVDELEEFEDDLEEAEDEEENLTDEEFNLDVIEDEEPVSLEAINEKLDALAMQIDELMLMLAPIEEPVSEEDSDEEDEEDSDEEDEEDSDEEDEEDSDEEKEDLSKEELEELGLTQEELDNLSDEELDYLIKIMEG